MLTAKGSDVLSALPFIGYRSGRFSFLLIFFVCLFVSATVSRHNIHLRGGDYVGNFVVVMIIACVFWFLILRR